MPSISEKHSGAGAHALNRVGAGEPSGEPAPPPGILDRMPDEILRQLPDEVIDQLLAGAEQRGGDRRTRVLR